VLARLSETYGGERPWFAHVVSAAYSDPQGPDWRQRTRETMDACLHAAGHALTDDDFQRICRAMAIPMRNTVSLEPGAAQAIWEARQLGLKLAICSNTLVRDAEDYRRDMEDLGLEGCFDAYVTSLEVGYGKPHPAMFQSALDLLGVPPGETAMVGDRPERDIVGARSVGLWTIWRRPPGFPGACDPPPTAEIRHLGELPGLLAEWARRLPSPSGAG
jgi:HAD superfamily hydrolase (TIGR01509 family)